MRQIKKHHGLKDEDDAYLQIMDACLKGYINVESKEHIIDAFTIAEILWHVYAALANYRLMCACGANINTTNRYVSVDLDIKREAINKAALDVDEKSFNIPPLV